MHERPDYLVRDAGSGPADIVDDITPVGGIQVPGGIEPIAMGVENPTAGGYAKIGTVISTDLGELGQIRPMEPVRFAAVDVHEAHQIARDERGRARKRARVTMAVNMDINCDLGETFGNWKLGADDVLLPLITTANLACGFHGGDPVTMQRTVAAAVEHGVAVGAHPGAAGPLGFGRRDMDVSPEDLYAYVVYQVGRVGGVPAPHGRRSTTSSRMARSTRCSTGTRTSPRPSSTRCSR